MKTSDNHISCSCSHLNFMLVCSSRAWLDDWDNHLSCYTQGHSKLQLNYVMATSTLPCRNCSFEVIFHADFLSCTLHQFHNLVNKNVFVLKTSFGRLQGTIKSILNEDSANWKPSSIFLALCKVDHSFCGKHYIKLLQIWLFYS